MIYVYAGLAAGTYVLFKVFQQRNVIFERTSWIVPTSLMMGILEVTIVSSIVTAKEEGSTLLAGLAIGLAGGIGAHLGIKIHGRFDSDDDKRHGTAERSKKRGEAHLHSFE